MMVGVYYQVINHWLIWKKWGTKFYVVCKLCCVGLHPHNCLLHAGKQLRHSSNVSTTPSYTALSLLCDGCCLVMKTLSGLWLSIHKCMIIIKTNKLCGFCVLFAYHRVYPQSQLAQVVYTILTKPYH